MTDTQRILERLSPLRSAPQEPWTERSLQSAVAGDAARVGQPILAEALDSPRASQAIRTGFRRDRQLNSRERRHARELIHGVVRQHRMLEALLRMGGWEGEERPRALWEAWLVLHTAHPAPDPRFAPLEEALSALGRRFEAESPTAAEAIALLASLPDSLVTTLLEARGLEDTLSLVAALDDRAPVALRANASRCTAQELAAELSAEGIVTRPGRWSSDALLVEGHPHLESTAAFREGRFELQDEGSQLIAELVQPPRGGLVLDACAGAGGKSLALAARAPRGMRLLACDTRADALRRGERRAKRAGAPVEWRLVDPEGPFPVEAGAAARVLLDLPCTGTGTLRRDPTLRWRLSPERVDALVELQASLLRRAATLVRPRGCLIHATCSLLPRENELQLERFLDEHPGWSAVPIAERLGAARARSLGPGPWLQLSPHRHGTDGFFAGVLRAPA